ncbi:MAG TPA: hypothetical protein VMS54_08470 [Vicinamibacterales bacterium]|nr:hypothetical protein [Vicinamibacterales bacterium]
MSSFDLTIRVVHVLGACIWLGAAFFIAWFLMPAMREAGPDGGKVMAAVQKRGWVVLMPVIATITVLTGFWLYRPYMGAEGNAAKYLGFGGVLGVIALVIGGGVVGRSMSKAEKLSANPATMAQAGALRAKAMTWVRIMSVLVIVTAILMTIAMYV